MIGISPFCCSYLPCEHKNSLIEGGISPIQSGVFFELG
ncbi:hypothetical protein KR50_14890 [Jeotgalibacillus campisalis]|uniref:Uncharacterized protein n=1 Tax=Jeotgalibacillus campisalis TaxID=220754 RepID=A0A0C2VWV6_9BACL|nr:hypothetical protein KR50_14890 [Jeotgalibacillus campisalis]